MLPVLNIIKQKITIPYVNKELTIRPYLVGEEKGLLIASESKDEKMINGAVKNIIKNCVEEKINVDELSSFEIEYIFLQLRKMSVNNVAELGISHQDTSECNHVEKIMINLDDVKTKGSLDNKIMLDEERKIGVLMRPPRLKDIEKEHKTQTEILFSIIQDSIESIFDAETVYHTNQYKPKELSDWLNTLNPDQFMKLVGYVENLPTLYYDIEYICPKCGKSEKLTVEGLANFL